MIHIKYDNKYQYDPHDVATIVGKKYIEYYKKAPGRHKTAQTHEVKYSSMYCLFSYS